MTKGIESFGAAGTIYFVHHYETAFKYKELVIFQLTPFLIVDQIQVDYIIIFNSVYPKEST